MLSIVAAVTSLAQDHAPVKHSTGAVLIQRSAAPDAPLMIMIDEVSEHGTDGAADVLYLFFSDTPRPQVQFHADMAQIQDLGNQLVINARGQQLTFALLGETPIKRGPNATVFADGTGLARHWGEQVNQLRVDGEQIESVGCDGGEAGEPCYNDWGGGGGGGGCDAGGFPATSCSVTSGNSPGCSVNCPNGYYACCKYGGVFGVSSCRCVRN
jgi:hypothetical protein